MTFHADLAAGFDNILATGGADIVYNGATVRAIIRDGADGGRLNGVEAIADECIILVRRIDVVAVVKGTAVSLDGEAWQVVRRVGGSRIRHDLLLRKKAAPVPRRSLV